MRKIGLFVLAIIIHTESLLSLLHHLDKRKRGYEASKALEVWQLHQKIFQKNTTEISVKQVQEATSTKLEINQPPEYYETLLSNLTDHSEEQAFALANKLFNYYIRENPLTFLQMHYQYNKQHLLKFIYTTLWVSFGKKGWKHWHLNTLQQLKETSKKIIYIAGGCDFYKPLQHGVKKLIIIDPFLPEQQRYYPEKYDYWIHGKTGETITLTDLAERLTRSSCIPGKWFTITTQQGYKAQITSLETIWETATNKRITIQRRAFQQEDLEEVKKRLFLISFNELFFFVAPSFLGGWNINLTQLPEDFTLLVKQLSKPLLKKDLITLRASLLLNACDVHFLALGNDVT